MSGRGRSQKSIDLVAAAITILEEIQPCSVRAVCYKLFALGLIPSMAKNETNRVGALLTRAREEGAIPWAWITDETREPTRVSAWEDPAAYVEAVKRSYRRDRWIDQSAWLEVWSEKATIAGTIAPVLRDYGVTLRVFHGYGSSTAVHQVADETAGAGRVLTAFYVGDWDPSGLHMSEVDLPDRLAEYGGRVDLQRLALVEDDTRGDLPCFSADSKTLDPRHSWFVKHFGAQCWELDALSPVVLRDRVEHAIVSCLDMAAWQRAEAAELAERESLATILNAWPGISRQASKYTDGVTS
ncbi:MAG: hypothetical protein NTV05_08390 [Acidobacteria bacterium]|nr:hypothetical protein [Acidobacteriota bacterium]